MIKLSLLVTFICFFVMEMHTQQVKATGKQVDPKTKKQLYDQWSVKNKDVAKSIKQEEKAYRTLVFKVNVDDISKHNSNPKRTYDMGLNEFSILTEEEFKQIMLTATSDKQSQVESQNDKNGNGRNLQVVALATSLNWTAKGKVTKVKNQGQCGSCWAFSATGALESTYLINLAKTLSLSEQELVDCSRGNGNYGCNGGWPTNAFNYIKAKKITTTNLYPYVAKDQACKRTTTMKSFAMKGYGYWTTGNCNNMKTQLNSRPLSVAVDATGWSRYKNGTFTCTTTAVNHAVLLVGYQTNGVWIVKNSWGTGWGEYGYIRLPGGNSCNICKYPSAALI